MTADAPERAGAWPRTAAPATLPFATGLRAHAARLAVVDPGGLELTYGALAERVDAISRQLGPVRRLVVVAAANDVDSLVGYLAGLQGGHAVLLAARDDRRHLRALIEGYDPDVVIGGGGRVDERREGTRHELHPELALLLCTSGSTGSPKLVRLSADAVASNAAAIADYLDIRDTDRAAVSLPMHYCYGLSVVNSNLLRGAALLLSDDSVTHPQFWSTFRAYRGTSVHGVPYTFELLDAVGFGDMRLPHLRYITQAGGRLAPPTVRRYAELGAHYGWRLFVMYGQTEATARMAYLPPDLAAAHPSTIGVPIPGGTFTIEPVDSTGAQDQGELVYHGPNVMLGYAHGPADLAQGRTVPALRTGDLARRRPDGLYELIGRRHRFIKPFGVRIDLDQLEALLADEGCAAACTGTDEELVVAVTGDSDPEHVRRRLTGRLGLPDHRVRALVVDDFPRRPNGKIDHQAVAALGHSRSRAHHRSRWRSRRPRTVREVFRRIFPAHDLPDDATFVGLGGDSLSYVQASIELQRVLGDLPASWDTTPIGRLASRGPQHRRPWATTETGVVLRAIAIVLIVGTHIGVFHVIGGAHLLFAASGWAFARFVLPAERPGPPPAPRNLPARILRSLARIAVPTALWIAYRALVQDDVDLANALLVNYVVDPAVSGYWYVESLAQTLLLLAVLFAVPRVRRLERAHPFGLALLVLTLALVGRLFPDTGNEFSAQLMSVHLVLWLFALGWVVHRATTVVQCGMTALLVVLLVPTFFPEPLRSLIVTAGLLLLLLLPRIALPQALVRPVGAVAAASLAIYLTHWAIYPPLLPYVPPWLVVAICIAAGIGTWWIVTAGIGRTRASLGTRR